MSQPIRRRTFIQIAAAGVASACTGPGLDADGGVDAGGSDANVPDVGAADGGAADSGAADVGAEDVGAEDVGAEDEGAPDGGVAPITGAIRVVHEGASRAVPAAVMLELDRDSLEGISVEGPAPDGVFDPRFGNLDVVWTMSQTYPFQHNSRTLPKYQNASHRSGPLASFTIREPGEVTFTATVTDRSGASGTLVLTRTFLSHDAVYTAPSQTIVVDGTGAGLPEYAGATVVRTFDEALAEVRASRDATVPLRVIGIAGQTYTATSTSLSAPATQLPSVLFMAHGAGPRPILNAVGGFNGRDRNGEGQVKDLKWAGWDLRGGYDPLTRTTTGATNDQAFYATFANAPLQFLMDDCRMRGFGRMLYPNMEGTTGSPLRSVPNFVINDCDFQDHYGYSMIGACNALAITGTRWADNPEDPWWPNPELDEYGLRLGKVGYVDIQSSNFFVKLTSVRRQPAFRLDTDGIGGGFLNFQHNWIEGARLQVVMGVEGGAAGVANTNNLVFSKNYCLLTHESTSSLGVARGGTVFESNIFMLPNVTSTNGVNGLVSFAGGNVPIDQRDEPVRFVGNTLYMKQSVSAPFITDAGLLTNLTIANNVTWKENETADGPMDESQLLGVPFCIGSRLSPGGALVRGSVTPANAGFIPIPTLASVGDVSGSIADGRVPIRNFFGDLHTGASRGATPAT